MILITGATGYIGKDVVEKLCNRYDIRIITRRNIENYPFEIVRGDITDFKSVDKAMKNVDYVVHLASDKNHFVQFSENSNIFKVNVLGTKNIINAAIKNNVKKIIYISSIASIMPIKTAYGETKRLAEELIKKYWNKIDISIIRTTIAYDLERLKKLRRSFFFPVTTKNFKIHFVYKKNLVDAIEKTLKKGKSDCYNIGDKKAIFFHDFHKAVLNTKLNPIYIPHSLTLFPIAFASLVKYGFNLLNINSPIAPEFLTHFFQDNEFDLTKSIKVLKYKPVDTIKTIKKLYNS